MVRPPRRRQNQENQENNDLNPEETETGTDQAGQLDNDNPPTEVDDEPETTEDDVDVASELAMSQFNKAKEEYVDLMGKTVLRQDDLRQGIRLHRAMTHLVIDNQDEGIYNLYWDFHVEQSGRDHENTIGKLMSEELALRGIDLIEDPIGERISVIYTLFRNHTVGDDRQIYDPDRVITILSYSNKANPSHLLEYLERRAKVISRT